MQSIYNINSIYEENLELTWDINNGNFTTDGQYFTIQHSYAVQNLLSIVEVSDVIESTTDANNYFTREFKWSFDTVSWTPFITLDDVGTGFPNPNGVKNVWFQVKYTWNTTEAKTGILKSVQFNGTRKIDPIFEPIVINTDDPKIFTNADTYKVFSIEDVNIYTVGNTPLTNIDIHFRYTQNQGRIWSQWYRLTADNLKSINFDPIRFCNFQFGFKNNSGSPFSLYDLELVGKFQNITAAYATTAVLGLKTQCAPILTEPIPSGPCDPNCLNGGSVGGSNGTTICGVDGKTCCVSCSTANTPWSNINGSCKDIDCNNSMVKINTKAVYTTRSALNEYLNNVIAKRDGYTFTYFLADPDMKGSDPILHEKQLHNILMQKDIQVIVPDGQFPNSDITLSSLDMDLIQTFEVHITKKTFKDAFGVEFRPGAKDFVYFCDMNQMWEVDQMIPARRGYNAETYWRVILKKYNDRKSRKFVNQGDKDFVDALTKHNTLDGLFGIQQDMEYQRIGKNENIDISNTAQLNNHQSMLSFIKHVDSSVSYRNSIINNGSVTLSESQYILPHTSRGKKFVTYNYADRFIKKGDNRAISMWFNTTKFDPTWDYSLLNNYDFNTNKGYKLDLFNGGLNFTLNSNTYNLALNNSIIVDTWYCLFVNLNQKSEELEIVIYKRQDEIAQSDSKLMQVIKNSWKITPDEFSHTEDIFLGGVDLNTTNGGGISSPYYLTNIRIYKQQLPKVKRNIVLNERVPIDTQLTLLVDNAEKRFQLPDYNNI